MSIVYIRGFPKTYKREDIRHLVIMFNPSSKIKIVNKDDQSFATLKFHDHKIANQVVKLLHNKIIEGNKLYVKICEKKDDHQRKWRQHKYNNTIYMRDFPNEMTEEKVQEIFGKYGDIHKITFTGKACFITFDDDKCRDLALKGTKFLKIGDKRVYVNGLLDKYNLNQYITKRKAKSFKDIVHLKK